MKKRKNKKSVLHVPYTGTRVLENTRPFLRSSIVNLWIILIRVKERKYHIFSTVLIHQKCVSIH